MKFYKSIQETAAIWGCSERNVQMLCKHVNILGVKKVSGVWLLPEEAVLQRLDIQNPSSALRAEQLYGRNIDVHISSHPAENAA